MPQPFTVAPGNDPGKDGGEWTGSGTIRVPGDVTIGQKGQPATAKLSQAITGSTVKAKGDLLVATANGAITNLTVGSDTSALIADSTQITGIKWGAVTDVGAIHSSLVTAKGDLIVATASGVVTNLAVGSNTQVLTADSTQASGMKWAATGGTVTAQTATVATSQTTTSTTYTDLATVGPSVTVTIGSSGIALVSVYVDVFSDTAFTITSFAASGANTIAASDQTSWTGGTTESSGSFVLVLTGLTAGSTTFKMKYRVNSGTGTFQNRRIGVVAF